MKRNSIQSWLDQSKNPFMENYPILEAPIDQPLPDNPDAPGSQIPNEPSPMGANNVDLEQDPGQEKMPGMNRVSAEPENVPENTPDFDETGPEIDFEAEKIDYMNLALKQKNDEMLDKLLEMRHVEKLSPGQYKFIEDNIQILSLSRDVDFADSQRKIYKQIKETFASLVPSEEEGSEEEENPQDIPPEETPNQIPMNPPAGANNPPEPEGIEIPQNQRPSMDMAHYDYSHGLKTLKFNEADEMFSEEETNISGTEVCSIISQEIEQYESIKEAILKLPSFYSMKADLFRKIIASLCNGIQIGSGGTLEDLFIPVGNDGVGVKLCTRMYTDFGNIQIGKWSLKFDDPENFLASSELEKMNNSGSPEEKEVLRKRVVIESIAEAFKDRVFVVMIIDTNTGTRTEIGFNFSELVKDGWKNGYISVNFKANVGKGAAGVKVDGELIDLQDIDISYVKEDPDNIDEEGKPVKEQISLMSWMNGMLYLSIMGEDFDNFSQDAKAGLFYSKKNFDAGPEELSKIQKCIPDIKEILLKKC